MIVTIHQPSYLPWAPFLEKGLQADVFVMLDDVQFEKNSEQNRNRIKTPQGETWLTVPVSLEGKTLIPDVRIAEQANWRRKHRRAIEESYRKAPFFDQVAPRILELYDQPWERLLDLNLQIDALMLEMAGFAGRIIRSSEMQIDGSNWLRILNICKALDAKTYLSGPGGRDYLDLPAFAEAGIEVRFQSYAHLEYPQLYPKAGFIPRLSAIDLLMNVGVGETARDVMLQCGKWEST